MSNICWCSIFDAYLEAQVLWFYEFWFFEGIGGQMCDKVEILIHISKPKSFLFVGFDFLEV